VSDDNFARLVDDLCAERRVVEAALVPLTSDTWDVPSAAAGWTLGDCVAHLAETDDNAAREIGGEAPPSVAGEREGVLTRASDGREASGRRGLGWYRDANDRLVAAAQAQGDDRLPGWAGR
jgi:hypothetical protein